MLRWVKAWTLGAALTSSRMLGLMLLMTCWPFLASCTRPQAAIIGYEYRPLANGEVVLSGPNGDLIKTLTVGYLVDADCVPIFAEAEDGVPPQWRIGDEPGVACKDRSDPLQRFFPWPDRDTALGWPHESGDYAGIFYLGDGRAEVDYHIDIEEDRGELTPIPVDGDDSALEPTSPDYYRRYRVTAEVDCEDYELPCEGTWRVDVLYDQPRDRVLWLYTTEE